MVEKSSRAVLIRFPELSSAESNLAARELAQRLTEVSAGMIETNLRKERPDSQDAGNILAIILGAEAVVGLADLIGRGIADYLRRINSRIEIVTEDGTIIATGEATKELDAKTVIKAIKKATNSPQSNKL